MTKPELVYKDVFIHNNGMELKDAMSSINSVHDYISRKWDDVTRVEVVEWFMLPDGPWKDGATGVKVRFDRPSGRYETTFYRDSDKAMIDRLNATLIEKED